MGGKPRRKITAEHRREMELLHELLEKHGYSIYEFYPKAERFPNVYRLNQGGTRTPMPFRFVRLAVPMESALADAMGEGPE